MGWGTDLNFIPADCYEEIQGADYGYESEPDYHFSKWKSKEDSSREERKRQERRNRRRIGRTTRNDKSRWVPQKAFHRSRREEQ